VHRVQLLRARGQEAREAQKGGAGHAYDDVEERGGEPGGER